MHSGLRRLSIHSDGVTVDVALSVTVPLGALIPAITDTLVATGNFSVGDVASRYGLSAPGGIALDASKTLAELAIRDGTPLTLIRSANDVPAARFDDAAEAVAASIAAVEQRWNRGAVHLLSALVATCLAGVSVTMLCRGAFGAGDGHRVSCVGVAATISVLGVAAAAIAYRIGERNAGLTLSLAAIACAALAGLVAVPGGPGAANAVVATAAATASAALVRMIACHATIFTTLSCFAATCLTAAMTCLVTAAPLPAIGVGSAAVSLALIEAAPSLSMAFARLSPSAVELRDQMHANVIQAHTWLTSLLAACSAAAALGALGALSEPSLPHIAFAAVTAGVLLLRSRVRRDIRQSAPSVVCGAITLCGVLVAAAVTNPDHALPIASLSMLLSVVALYAGFMSSAVAVPPTARRGIELLQYFALAAVAPLALWLCGLYSTVRGLNLL